MKGLDGKLSTYINLFLSYTSKIVNVFHTAFTSGFDMVLGIFRHKINVMVNRYYLSHYFLFKMLTGKPTGKRHLGRSRPKWEDNIRMDLKEKGINRRNWVNLAQDRDYWRALVNAALYLRIP